jgi:predicted Zn-dependent protease
MIVSSSAVAQEENVILKAMKDEMNRSTTEIKYDGHEKPFFINYTVNDARIFSAFASLGALLRSGEFRNRSKNVRILVGNYEFNDESLDNDLSSDLKANEIQLPLEDDYYGIRRAFWTTTDAIYKGAAQKYKKHQTTLKEDNKTIQDLPHRTFARIQAIQSVSQAPAYVLEKEKWEQYCREISASFKTVKDIESADAMFNFTQTIQYFVNSEGTTIVRPKTMAIIQCRATATTKNGQPVTEQFVHYAETPDQLPSLDELKKKAGEMAQKLAALQEATELEEEYNGPVLFIGYPAAQVMATSLFSFRENLSAGNTLPAKNEFRQESSLENRIGKVVIDNNITVKATPKLKTFNGKTLLGSFAFDNEGVTPADETVLIEKGILKNLMNDRSLTKPEQVANGLGSGPGVVQISAHEGFSIEALKQKLISAAKEEGLEYAVLVRSQSGGGGQLGIVEAYKVSLQTGKEELMRPARLNNISLKNLKRIPATMQQQLYHIPLGSSGLTSLIAPEAILVAEAEVTPVKMSFTSDDEKPLVESPLKK